PALSSFPTRRSSDLTTTHTNFNGFCCIRFIWENFDPYFPATFHITSHCNTSGFDLTTCNPRCFCCLQAVFTKCYICAASCFSFHTSTVLSTILYTFWH